MGVHGMGWLEGAEAGEQLRACHRLRRLVAPHRGLQGVGVHVRWYGEGVVDFLVDWYLLGIFSFGLTPAPGTRHAASASCMHHTGCCLCNNTRWVGPHPAAHGTRRVFDTRYHTRYSMSPLLPNTPPPTHIPLPCNQSHLLAALKHSSPPRGCPGV